MFLKKNLKKMKKKLDNYKQNVYLCSIIIILNVFRRVKVLAWSFSHVLYNYI
jgi:hypothetical protein